MKKIEKKGGGHYSPSSLQLFLESPLEYYYRYIEKREDKKSHHLAYGSAIHETIKFFYEEKEKGKRKTKVQLGIYFSSLFTKYLNQLGEREKQKGESLRNTGKLTIYKYWDKFSGNNPLVVEQFISYFIDGYEIRNIVDAIYKKRDDLFGDEWLEIEDYKTMKNPFNAGQLYTNFQMRSYILAVEDFYKLPVKKFSFIILTKDSNPKIYRQSVNLDFFPEPEWRDNFRKDISQIISAIESKMFWRKYGDEWMEYNNLSTELWGTQEPYLFITTQKNG
jgi:hypothetical protein